MICEIFTDITNGCENLDIAETRCRNSWIAIKLAPVTSCNMRNSGNTILSLPAFDALAESGNFSKCSKIVLPRIQSNNFTLFTFLLL